MTRTIVVAREQERMCHARCSLEDYTLNYPLFVPHYVTELQSKEFKLRTSGGRSVEFEIYLHRPLKLIALSNIDIKSLVYGGRSV